LSNQLEEYFTTKYLKVKPVAYPSMSGPSFPKQCSIQDDTWWNDLCMCICADLSSNLFKKT